MDREVMMSVKMYQLLNPKFQDFLARSLKAEIHLHTARRVKKCIETVKEELNQYEEMRKDLLTKYGNKKEDGSIDTNDKGEVQFTDENREVLFTKLEELHNIDVDLPVFKFNEFDSLVLTVEHLEVVKGLLAD